MRDNQRTLELNNEYYPISELDNDLDLLTFQIRESTFHHSNAEAMPVIDLYLENFPWLLDYHSKEWYYEHC